MIIFHACAVRDGGITIYDACPTQEAFERFSTGEGFEQALAAAGLPRPSIEGRPLHAALGPGGAGSADQLLVDGVVSRAQRPT